MYIDLDRVEHTYKSTLLGKTEGERYAILADTLSWLTDLRAKRVALCVPFNILLGSLKEKEEPSVEVSMMYLFTSKVNGLSLAIEEKEKEKVDLAGIELYYIQVVKSLREKMIECFNYLKEIDKRGYADLDIYISWYNTKQSECVYIETLFENALQEFPDLYNDYNINTSENIKALLDIMLQTQKV